MSRTWTGDPKRNVGVTVTHRGVVCWQGTADNPTNRATLLDYRRGKYNEHVEALLGPEAAAEVRSEVERLLEEICTSGNRFVFRSGTPHGSSLTKRPWETHMSAWRYLVNQESKEKCQFHPEREFYVIDLDLVPSVTTKVNDSPVHHVSLFDTPPKEEMRDAVIMMGKCREGEI